MQDAPRFSSVEEEAKWWKEQARSMQDALQEAENGLQEFMESSKELETELEADVLRSAEQVKLLQKKNESLQCDVDESRAKYQQALLEHNTTLSDLHREMSKLRESHESYKKKLREMELDNDELENAERMINSSLSDMERQYNGALQRTAALENQLQDKTRLEEENQRLKDELRDVREELTVLQSANEANSKKVSLEEEDLQLSDLVSVKRSVPTQDTEISTTSKANTLERLRNHMKQLQSRLQTAQVTTFAARPHAERSALPRPRSSLSASQSGIASPRRSQTPLARPESRMRTPMANAETSSMPRPSTPTSIRTDRTDRRKSSSFIPLPSNGLSRSQSLKARPSSRLAEAPQPNTTPSSTQASAQSTMRTASPISTPMQSSTASPLPPTSSSSHTVPYEFMEHDPSQSPVRRGSVLGRRRSGNSSSMAPPRTHTSAFTSSTSGMPSTAPRSASPINQASNLPRSRIASPSKLRTSPTKPNSPTKPIVPWR